MQNDPFKRESQATHSPSSDLSTVNPQAEQPNRVVALSTPQEQALEWLMGGGSIGEAAQFAGVSRQTISRWLRGDPDFRAVYEAWKQDATQALEGRLVAAGEAAMDNLITAVRTNGNVRTSEFIVRTLLARNRSAR